MPKIIAFLFLLAVAAGVGAYLALCPSPAVGVQGARKSSRGGKGRDGARKGAPGTLSPNGPEVVELYVGNLSFDMTDAQLRAAFEKFGVVSEARIVMNRNTGRSKGFGFVTMPHRKEAAIAVKALDNSEVMGRKMRVNEARGNTNQA